MKLQCLKLFNEQGLYIMPGVAEVSDQLGNYLLSNWPAYFAVPSTVAAAAVTGLVMATPGEVSSSSDSGGVESPGVTGQSGDVAAAALTEGPPADKAVKAHRTRRKAA